MTEREWIRIMRYAETIKGEINRMCITNELFELDTMCEYAKKNLDILLKTIHDARFRVKSEVQDADSD